MGADELDPPSVSDVLGVAVESALQADITRTKIENGMTVIRVRHIIRNTLIMVKHGQ